MRWRSSPRRASTTAAGAGVAPLLLVVAFGLLTVVLVPGIGIYVDGARRWLGSGQFRLQPSEIAKFALLVFCADVLARRQHEVADWRRGLRPDRERPRRGRAPDDARARPGVLHGHRGHGRGDARRRRHPGPSPGHARRGRGGHGHDVLVRRAVAPGPHVLVLQRRPGRPRRGLPGDAVADRARAGRLDRRRPRRRAGRSGTSSPRPTPTSSSRSSARSSASSGARSSSACSSSSP